MRPLLALSLVCLALTLALNYAPALFPGASGEGRLADRALDVLVGAKGPLLPAARVDANERMGEVIRLGDRTLVGAGQSGLRAAFLGRGFELRAERCFDVARSEADARALRAAVEQAEPGAVVVLASSGRLAPAGASAAPAELTRALAELGARARPGAATPESWAFLAARLERGWVPLAEAYSRDSGVALAFTLSGDLESYARHRGELALVRAPARGEITLEDELAHADERSGRVELAPDRTVLGRPLAGMLFAPRAGEPARVVWRDVAIGPGSGFVAWLGLADGASTGSDGVDFALRVDGELVLAQRIVAGAPWKVVQVDLRRFAQKRVTLELAADAGASDAGDVALVGRPLLVYGYDRSPLEALAGER